MDSRNHYETAFRAYLQHHGHSFVAVDESHRSQYCGQPLKSLDFIVCGGTGRRFLVDVKGRRFPTGGEGKRRRVWECWSTIDDVKGLESWVHLFGPACEGLLVFVYELLPEVSLLSETEDLWEWRERRYLLRAVEINEYRECMRVRSPRWGTVSLPSAVFRRLVRPFRDFASVTLDPSQPNECPF